MPFVFNAITVVLAASAVIAAPSTMMLKRHAKMIKRQGCNVGPIDMSVVDTIYNTCLDMGCNYRVMQSAMDTCIQESNCNNLKCGDQDSQGAFQQRPSEGWGTLAQITDVAHAATSYLTIAIANNKANPGLSPGDLAQSVQNAQAGQLYSQHDSQAIQLINQAAKDTGRAPPGSNGGAAAPASSSKKAAPASSSKAAAPAAKSPAPVTVAGAGGAANVGAAPTTQGPAAPAATGSSSSGGNPALSGSPDTCSEWYQPVPGNTCLGVAAAHNISLEDFYCWNTQIDDECQNLQVTFKYCVKA